MPLKNKSIFSGDLFQYLEENKKWRNRFLFIPDSYNINYYENKQVMSVINQNAKNLNWLIIVHPKSTINRLMILEV